MEYILNEGNGSKYDLHLLFDDDNDDNRDPDTSLQIHDYMNWKKLIK